MITDWTLTTDHPASSYGLPVFILKNVAYGPRDKISKFLVAEIVHEWAEEDGRTNDELSLAGSFLRQWPDGPQLDHVPGVMGQPRQFGKTELVSFRCPQELADRIPTERKARADFLRSSVEHELDRKL